MTKFGILKTLGLSENKDNIVIVSLFTFVFTFCFFGGAEPRIKFNLLLMFICGIFLIVAIFARNYFTIFSKLPIFVKLVLIAPIILPLIQIVPLPYEIWGALPGHELRSDVLRLVDKSATWQPLSLTPAETAYTAAMGMFFSAFLLCLMSITSKYFNYVKVTIVVITVMGIVVGAFQFSGTFPALNFYEDAHTNMLVGFFANKNHMALILAVNLILSKQIFYQKKNKHGHLLFILFTIFLVIAVIATNSRAGIGLMLVTLLLIFGSNIKTFSRKILICASLFVVLIFYYISSSPTFDIVYDRFSDVGEDVRWDFLVSSSSLMREFFLLGSGYGSFSSVYMTRESVEALSPVYTNHLHSDFLQLMIEGGILGVLALAILGFSIFKAWRVAGESRTSRDEAWVGLSIVLLFGLHSIVDYPMRRPAAVVYFCVGLACLFRAILHAAESPTKWARPTQTA